MNKSGIISRDYKFRHAVKIKFISIYLCIVCLSGRTHLHLQMMRDQYTFYNVLN